MNELHDALKRLAKIYNSMRKEIREMEAIGDLIEQYREKLEVNCPKCGRRMLYTDESYFCFLCNYMVKEKDYKELMGEINS